MTLEDALKRVEDHADRAWLEVAYRCMHYLSSGTSTFTADDFWELIEKHYPSRAAWRSVTVDPSRSTRRG
jgi:hypothetical protein